MAVARLAAIATLLTTLSVGLAGCGSGYTYVTSTSTRTFFKVPSAWKVWNKAAVLTNPPKLSNTTASTDRFLVEFDADPSPSLAHDFVTGSFPFGEARVHGLDLATHDSYSLASLRNEIIPVDDLVNQSSDKVNVLSRPKLLTHRGLRGSELEYSVQLSDGTSFSVDQIGFVDSPTQTVWFLLVGCSTSCYRHNEAAIHRVIASWTVEGK